jgi:AsmA protein
LNLALNQVSAFGGNMTGTIAVTGGNGIAFKSNLKATKVQLEPMLSELLDIDRLRGTGNTNLKLSGRGSSLHELMNSLSGTGDVSFGEGSIRGIDLAAMMKNLKSAFGGFEGATEFTSLTGTFSMEKGVLQNVDLSLISPLFKAGGKGSIDVGGQAMNYVVTPTALSKDAEFSVPVIITGPWSNLKFRPDVEKLLNLLANTKLKDNAEVQKAKDKLNNIKEKLKNPEEALKAKLAKELAKKQPATNTTSETPTEAKSLEEQAKDKLQNEVGNALNKLFKK